MKIVALTTQDQHDLIQAIAALDDALEAEEGADVMSPLRLRLLTIYAKLN